jgi:hypothetical protein
MNSRPWPTRRSGAIAVAAFAAIAMLALPAVGSARDRNRDRIPDRWEKRHDLSLKVKQSRRDQDGDGLRNLGEYRAGTDPRDADSDNDGIPDGQENAGTIASFDGTTLTISLYAGGEVSGEVTDQTRIICPSSDDGSADTATSSADSASEGGGCQQGEPCTADSLAVGAKVVEAELRATSEGSVFTKVKLG